MPEKTINGYLVVNWKSGDHRTRKKKPKKGELGKNELLAKIKVNVSVPEVDVPTLAVDIDVPEPQVYAATLEALEDEELPDWTDAVHEAVADRIEDVRSAEDGELIDLVDVLTSRALLAVNTRPNPEHVNEYVTDLVYQVRDGEEPEEVAVDG